MAFHGTTRRSFGNFICGAAAPLGFLLLAACAAPQDTDTGPIFYPPLPELPRLQFLKTINTEDDIGGGGGGLSLFGGRDDRAAMLRPFEVAHVKGKIYVADASLRAIVVLDLAEKKFKFIDETEGGPFRSPMGISIAEDGFKYISDAGREQVLVLDENDNFHRTYGKKGQFRPLAAVVDGDKVYVSDTRQSEVETLDRETGDAIGKVGTQGTEDGRFQWPTRLALGAGGNLYVTDFLNFRVQEFDRNGQFIKAIGELGNWPGAMPRPKGIAVDRDGYLYVVDAAFELVQIFDTRTAEVLLGFGKNGPKPGGNWLPSGIDIDYDNVEYFSKYVDKNFSAKYLVYVVNQAGPRKLNVYAFGDWIGPPPKGATQPADAAQPADAGS